MKNHGRVFDRIIATGNMGGVQLLALTAIALLGTSCAERIARTDGNGGGSVAAQQEARDPASSKQVSQQVSGPRADAQANAEYHFSMGQAYVDEGDPDRAIEEFRLTLMYDHGSALVYSRLATEYIKKGMLDEAMDSCKQALEIDPKYTDARLMLAGLYSAAHENDQSLSEYNRILRYDPHQEEAAVYRAQTLADMNEIGEAARSLRTFLKKNSESVLAWYSLGRAEESQDHFKEAVLAYRKAVDLRPGFNQPALSLGYLYETKGMNKQALATYQDLWDQTQDTAAANRIATIYLKEEKYELAVPYLEAVQASDPDDLNADVKLGLVQMELKQFDNAVATFKAILKKNPDSDRVHYYLGSIYEEQKDYDGAIAELKKIKPDSKMYSDSVLHVAYLFKELKGIDEAKDYINGEIQRSPHQSTFYIYSASLDEESKNLKGAIALLEKAVMYSPDDQKARYYLGSLYDRVGQVDRGLSQMEAILQINPDNVDALNYIGYTWTQKGIRLDDAEKLLRKALALKPDNGYVQDSWGWYLFVRGRVSEAVVQLEKAVALKPTESTILEHLGDAYLRSNLREKALEEYSRAEKYADDDSSRAEIATKKNTLVQELAQGGRATTTARVPASSTETHRPIVR